MRAGASGAYGGRGMSGGTARVGDSRPARSFVRAGAVEPRVPDASRRRASFSFCCRLLTAPLSRLADPRSRLCVDPWVTTAC